MRRESKMIDSDTLDSVSDSYYNRHSSQRNHVSENRPKNDIVHPSRLQGYSDAVFATTATLLVIPVRRFEADKKESLEEALSEKWIQFVVFVFGYLLICRIWEKRAVRFNFIQKVDDFLVGMALLSLMVTTFLPFSIALVSYHSDYCISTLINCLLLLFLDLIELVIFVYGFQYPTLLSNKLQVMDLVELRAEKYQLFVKIAIDVLVLTIAASISYVAPKIALILVLSILVNPWIIHLIVRNSYRCVPGCQEFRNYQSPFKLITGSIDKDRIECFSDAAIAIVATILILDLTTEDFPKNSTIIANGGLEQTLARMWLKFVSYIGTYGVVSFLWFVNHSVLHHIKIFTPAMVLFNKLFLVFLAASPFITTLVDLYINRASHNATLAVQLCVGVLFMASIFNLLILVFAVWNKNDAMYEWAWPKVRQNNGANNPVHTYLLLKCLILPVVCFVTYIVSLTTDYASYITFHVATFSVPVIFILLKVFFTCQHCRKKQNGVLYGPQTDDLEDSLNGIANPEISLMSRRGVRRVDAETSDSDMSDI